MERKPTYEELEQRVKKLERVADEYKRKERALQVPEQDKEAILNSLLEHVIHQDTEMKILWANRAACESVNLTHEELVGRHCYEVWPQRSDPCPDCPVKKAIETCQPQEIEKTTPDGRSWFIRGYPLRDSNGKINGGIEVTLEVTDRKWTEDALKERDEKYRLLAENVTDVIWTMDMNMRFTYYSPSIEQLQGYTPEEAIGLTLQESLTADSFEKAIKVFNEELEKHNKGERDPNEPITLELDLTCKDGSTKMTEITTNFIYDLNGHPIRVIGVARDITERKQAEEALRESEEKYRHLFEMESDAIFLIRNSDGQIFEVNTAGVNLYGFSREELLKMKNADLSAEPDETRKATLKRKREVPTRYHKKKDGTVFPVEITANHFTWRGEEVHIASIRDIAKRKKVEKALRESEERYKSLFKNNHSVMLLIDPENADIVDANPAAISFYGWSHEELTRKKITNINTLTKRQVFQEMKRAKTEQRRIFYFKHRLASGKIRDVEVYSGPIKVYDRELLYSIIHDLIKRKQTELALIDRRKELENKTHELEEVNTALNVLLKRREQDKTDLEEKVLANVKELVFPYVEKLNNCRLNDRQMVFLNIIKSNLEGIITPYLHKLSSKHSDLTPSEIQVAGLVKDGKTTKEIAAMLDSSTGAIDFHRNNLRKKLGLRNTKTNLRSFLLSFT